ncbi:hypothetical protein KKA17_08075 [bacterium]|nr:hypothetical protein [bacterium]MBU1883349.1 hypothetical protein [bacterium]
MTFQEIFDSLNNGTKTIDEALGSLTGTLTSAEAEQLTDFVDSKENLTKLVSKLDTVGNGKSTTLLFSGSTEYQDTVKSLKDEYRTIQTTEAYEFLKSEKFTVAVNNVFDNDLNAANEVPGTVYIITNSKILFLGK